MKPKINRKPGPMDNCQTPPYALEPVAQWFWKYDTIWEPAAGMGIMARTLADKYKFKVVSSDIKPSFGMDLHNFLDHDPYPYVRDCDAIITNPPYSLKYQWLQRCTDVGLPWALLLPVETLGAKKFLQLAAKEGLCVLLMYPRVDFRMPDAGWDGGGAQFPTCWVMGSFLNGHLQVDDVGKFYVHRLDKRNKQEMKLMEAQGLL